MTGRRVQLWPIVPNAPQAVITFDLVGDPSLSGGVGGWSEISRPRRTNAAEWTSTPARSQVLPLLLDGMEYSKGVDVSVEPQIASLIAWGTKQPATGQPVVLGVSGPVHATDGRWVLNDLDWGTLVRDSATGNRIQQKVTVTLLELLEPTLLSSPARKARNHKGKGGK